MAFHEAYTKSGEKVHAVYYDRALKYGKRTLCGVRVSEHKRKDFTKAKNRCGGCRRAYDSYS